MRKAIHKLFISEICYTMFLYLCFAIKKQVHRNTRSCPRTVTRKVDYEFGQQPMLSDLLYGGEEGGVVDEDGAPAREVLVCDAKTRH